MKHISSFLSKIFIAIMALITLFPFIYMILASFMTFQEATSIPPTLFPADFNWHNFVEAFEKAPFVRYFFNTIFVASITTTCTLITTIFASFAFVKYEFKGKALVLMLMAALLMVPYEVTVFTNFQTIAKMGLLDTFAALIIPSMASIFYIFYLKEYLTSIPPSYYKAAKPALFTMGILSFIGGWNSFLWPILVTNSPEMRLLSNGLSAFATESGTDVHLQMAASTIAIVPILILYLIFKKQIIRGVVKSGVKG